MATWYGELHVFCGNYALIKMLSRGIFVSVK
jgi:hypothetical protein